MMKNYIFYILLLTCLPYVWLKGQVSLDFNHTTALPTQVQPFGSAILGSFDTGEFTVDVMFKSEKTFPANEQTLFSLFLPDPSVGNPDLRAINIGLDTNGELLLDTKLFGTTSFPSIYLPDNQWHHLVLSKNSTGVLEISIDCNLITSISFPNNFQAKILNLGKFNFDSSISGEWNGEIDNFRLWKTYKTVTEICDITPCYFDLFDPDLELFYDFEDGIPNGNNTSVASILDKSPNGYNAQLFNFILTGSIGNFVSSPNKNIDPDYSNLTLEVKDYPYQTSLINQICSGDAAHFRLTSNGIDILPNSRVSVEWHYVDVGGTDVLINSPLFEGSSFGIPRGNITIDCTSAVDGYVDRDYYAVVNVSNSTGSDFCQYKSPLYRLRICCEINNLSVDILPITQMCEGETTSLQICLNSSHPFVNPLSSNIGLKWYFDGNYLPAYDNQICFSYSFTAPAVANTRSFCFSANVYGCCNTQTAEKCVTVDKKPVCGSIVGYPYLSPTNLTLIATSPHLTYEICPGNDAALEIDPSDPIFGCDDMPWEYTFDLTSPIVWNTLGNTNSVQNTNILPKSFWPGDRIYYRSRCLPPMGSSCPECESNLVEIRLKQAPLTNGISGQTDMCSGDVIVLNVNSPVSGNTYEWYENGMFVGNGTSIMVSPTRDACYWFIESDGCFALQSPNHCVKVCDVIPILSCPLAPNECAKLNEPIHLSGCDSYSTCGSTNLSYLWYVDGLQFATTCDITHTPLQTGSIYELTVTDNISGCTRTTSTTIIPCDY